MEDIFAQDAAYIAAAPDDEQLRSVAAGARRLLEIERELEHTRIRLAELQETRRKLSQQELPALFDEVGTDRIGLPDSELDVVVEPYFYANISSSWEEEKRTAAFDHLESLGAGALVRYAVTVSFDRDEIALARDFIAHVQRWNSLGNRTIETKRAVPWNSLTAWLREYITNPPAINAAPVALDLLGATVGRVCKIVKRAGKRKGK